MNNLSSQILEKIDLENSKLSDSYFYNSLPLCVIDSIYSIGVRYESVKNVISNFCDYTQIKKYRCPRDPFLNHDEQYSVIDFLEKFETCSPKYMAEDVFKNKQRTSTKNGILKSQAVIEFLNILAEHDIKTFQDLHDSDNSFHNKIRKIKGQKSGISLQYFYRLAGSDKRIKPDITIQKFLEKFLEKCLNRKVTNEEALCLIERTCGYLKTNYSINITLRKLEHAIWNYQRNPMKKS